MPIPRGHRWPPGNSALMLPLFRETAWSADALLWAWTVRLCEYRLGGPPDAEVAISGVSTDPSEARRLYLPIILLPADTALLSGEGDTWFYADIVSEDAGAPSLWARVTARVIDPVGE